MNRLILSIILLAGIATTCVAQSKNGNKAAAPAYASTKAVYPGSSFETAIPIPETSERVGTRAEYAWLKKTYPGYKLHGQSLRYNEAKVPFDVIHIKTADSLKRDIFFNISQFYGKF